VTTLGELVRRPGHVVAQVVEAELVVRAVRDVGGVLVVSLGRLLPGEDASRAEAEEPEHTAHQLALVLREVVVHGDDVDTVAGQGVEVGGECGDQRLALTGLHLGDASEVQRSAAHDLHVEVPLPEGALRSLTNRREGFGKQIVERLARLEPLLETVGLLAELGVGQRAETVLQGIHLS